jgi:predicted enzyme related to lactoylglutathione lyase
MTNPLRGFATVSFYAADLDAAKAWYADLLGVEPYFEVPDGYFEFRIGDYEAEFGFINARYAPYDLSVGPAGAVVYWHVDDVHATLQLLTDKGAVVREEPVDRGGFVTASVVDPFGNVLGIMYNPHYLEIRGRH